MVVSSNRSPSPISSRPNPNSRTPESGTRKSFNGNPFVKPSIASNRKSFNPVTPANSPAEFSQRNCKEGLRVSYEQKENEKDNYLKPVRARSPVVSSTGTKNFMAPTISAASKIAAASPRKKILGERNEAVRVSDSISDEKLCHSEFVEEIGSKTPITLEALSMAAPLSSEALNILTTPKNNRSSIPVSAEKPLLKSLNHLDFSGVEEIEAKLDENLISETLPEPKSMGFKKIKAPPLAPLDADPSAPPYDPKTNYLSPRPLFLHYRPNPRIEVLLNKEAELNPVEEGRKRLEDSFSSESCSGSENTQETQDSDAQIESEDVYSETKSEKEEETTHLLHENDIVRVKKISNLRFSSRLKIMPLLLVLVVACLTFPVIDSPLYTSSMHKYQTSSKLESSVNIVELAKANLDGLAYNFKLWLVKSIFHVSTSKSIPIVFEELGPLLSINLTALDKELLVSQFLDYGEKETEELQVENSLEPGKEGEMEEEPTQDENFMGSETDEKVEEEIAEEDGNKENEVQSAFERSEAPGSELEMSGDLNQKFLQTDAEDEIKESLVQQHGNIEIEDQSSLVPEATESIEEANTDELADKQIEVEPNTSEAAEFHGENIEPINAELTPKISESDTPAHRSEPEDASSMLDIETLESATNGSKDKFAQTVVKISSVLLILMASTAFVYLRIKKPSSTTTTTTTTAEVPVMVKELPSKKVSPSISLSASGDSQHPHLERLSSQNWPSSHIEMTGHSGPLEVSTSYQHSSSCNPRGSEILSEAQSQERKPRRNSNSTSPLEYSSGLSPSYGSFTTYEKIQNKHGYGEDEVVTPVRRSSRIRKLVTSP